MNKRLITYIAVGILIVIVLAVVWLLQGSASQVLVAPVPTNGTATSSGGSTVGTTSDTATNGATKSTKIPVQNRTKTAYAAVVQYTSKGFSPAVVHIKAGQVVHFVNTSNLGLRVHTLTQGPSEYVGLDQQQVVGKGGTYDFLFNNPGTWGYYNLVGNPSYTGVVIVDPQ